MEGRPAFVGKRDPPLEEEDSDVGGVVGTVESIGLRQPRAVQVTNLEEASAFLDEVGLPVVV